MSDRRIIVLSVVIMIIVTAGTIISNQAFSDADIEKSTDAFELTQGWAKEWELTHSYPEYISGIWVEGEMYCIGVTDDVAGYREGRKLQKQLRDNDSVRIVFQKYSYNELYKIVDELYPHMGEYFIENMGVKNSENYVYVALNKDISEKMRAAVKIELIKRYGNRIHINDEPAEGFHYSIADE